MLANNSKSNKIQNRQVILKLLAMKAPISRVELSLLSGLSKMSLTNIISEFKEEGFIVEVGVDTTAEGKRKPVLLELADNAINALGVNVSQTEIQSCYADIKSNIYSLDACPIPAGAVVDSVVSFVQNKIKNSPVTLSGAGVSFDATFPNELRQEIVNKLQEQEIPMFFASNAQCALLAEKRYGGAKGLDSVLYASYNPGYLDCALYANKKMWKGHTLQAGAVPCENVDVAVEKLKDIIAFSNPQAVLFYADVAHPDVCAQTKEQGVTVRHCILGERAPILGSATLVFDHEYFS